MLSKSQYIFLVFKYILDFLYCQDLQALSIVLDYHPLACKRLVVIFLTKVTNIDSQSLSDMLNKAWHRRANRKQALLWGHLKMRHTENRRVCLTGVNRRFCKVYANFTMFYWETTRCVQKVNQSIFSYQFNAYLNIVNWLQ